MVHQSLEAAKIYLANNTDCAGFHMINNDTITFFKKAGVQCGETLQTYNSMLPLTEDRNTECITVWKPLVYKIKNPNNIAFVITTDQTDLHKIQNIVKTINELSWSLSEPVYLPFL